MENFRGFMGKVGQFCIHFASLPLNNYRNFKGDINKENSIDERKERKYIIYIRVLSISHIISSKAYIGVL